MADQLTRSGYVVRADYRGRTVYLSPCGAGADKRDRAAEVKVFGFAEDAAAFGQKLMDPRRAARVDSFTVLAETIHTLKVSGAERELIRLALLAGNTDQQQLAAALFKEAVADG